MPDDFVRGILNFVPFRGISIVITLSLFVVSCAEFQDKSDEPPPPPSKKGAPESPAAPEPLPEAPATDDGLGFMDPNTTERLITNETTKTVVGPVIPNPEPPTDDSAITIDPPKIPAN